ncbi:hypothetical protein BABA_22768 [Neobacillus bataviensis LMG 21833]|uniref:Uncharacterized protein n=1 Tax=Neobacillus bataviensis LMG 21833 TaxID=1117379 RepID=K6C0S2_9BACI|nr:hypothetical protein [Neobacillus bataviensis]EKN64760.1 hypothetical protein BABA_22768 [Neobacillus bataviensis LMG 21833]
MNGRLSLKTNGNPHIDGFLNGNYDTVTVERGSSIDRFGNNGGEQWVYLFIDYERNSDGREMVLETFQEEVEAVSYYYLVTLQSYYFNEYVLPYKNSLSQIDRPGFTIDQLQLALSSLQVNHTTYHFYDEEVVPHSIHLKRVSPTECKVQYIGENKQVVFETMKLEDWDAFSTMFDYVYFFSIRPKMQTVSSKSSVR